MIHSMPTQSNLLQSYGIKIKTKLCWDFLGVFQKSLRYFLLGNNISHYNPLAKDNGKITLNQWWSTIQRRKLPKYKAELNITHSIKLTKYKVILYVFNSNNTKFPLANIYLLKEIIETLEKCVKCIQC